MVTTKIGLSKEFPWCIRDGEVYCSTLCKNGHWDRSPLDTDVKAFKTREHARKYANDRTWMTVEIVIPSKELENQE